MPYSSIKELPDAVKKLPKKAQRAFKSAFNSAVKQGKSEQQAFKIAWSAAKRADGDESMEWARNVSTEERKKLAKKGHAMSDGSFPIANKADLKNAIQAYGRASNKAAVKRHIIKRAKALGATNLLPDSWKNGDKAMSTIECPTCPRQFLDEAALTDHAEAVHTLSERRSLVSRAVRAAHGKDAYMVDLSDDWLVYDKYDESTREYRLYKQAYSLDASGNVKITGESKEVVRKIAYIPAPKVEVASASLSTLDIALSTSINGVPPSDAPHEFAQEDPAFDPNICTDCGRHKVHSIHTNTADKASDEKASYREYSQVTVEDAKSKSQTPHKFKPQSGNTTVCAVCNRAEGDKLHKQSS